MCACRARSEESHHTVCVNSKEARERRQLPPQEIQMVHTGRNGCLFVISFHHGHVCAVWKDTFQVASQWSGISSVHVDDFLRCGTDQMLLISKDQDVAGPLLDQFLLTDLCGISISRSQDSGATKKPPPPESYLLTLRALESRLQSGLAVLQELQQESAVTDKLIHQSVKTLIDLVSGREPVFTKPEQEGLVALWDSDDDDDVDESTDEALDDKTQDMPAVSSEPQVDKLWHRIAENQMVVGVILTTEGSVPLASVSLSILTEMSQSSAPAVIQTKSQVCWLPLPWSSSSSSSSSSAVPTSLEPAAKRSKQHIAGGPDHLDTRRLAVTAVTELTPLLNSGCVKCCVMLHYIQSQDAFSLVSNPTPVVRYCGQVVIDIQSDFQAQLLKNPELKTDEMKEDLMSLLAVLNRWVFLIDSPDHSLGDINGWIQKRVGCERIEVSPQYLLFNSSTPSAVMLVHWHQISPFQGELTVHSSQLQMMQFLSSLLTFLPASCSVHPMKGPRQQGAARMFSVALEKEVESLRERVSALLREDGAERGDEGGHGRSSGPGAAEGLQRSRDEWQRDVDEAKKRLSPVVDVEKYRELTLSLSKLQLNWDLAALLEIEQTLLS
ncbi:Fanconi anemia group B protein isoform X2 [Betta splendens]|uniref:Fanconi anemia group B protein isoform X2 n=1 Tax=Betta splendens TaxID=158456 RepID=A0A9W2XHM2_BETSP|nr:Fanconi anemia group B protein isoform X2 [Betta splendens]